jgi:hypothetical protein
MLHFLEHIGESLRKTPQWWWIVTGPIAAILAAFRLSGGGMPTWITHFWVWWFLLLTVIFFVGCLLGAFNVSEEYRKQVETLEAENKAEKEKAAQKRPKLYLKYKHPGASSATFSGLLVGNHGEPAHGISFRSGRARNLEIKFYDTEIVLNSNEEHEVNLAAVYWQEDDTPDPIHKFFVATGQQLETLFNELRKQNAEEKIAVTIDCKDYDQKPHDFPCFIARDSLGNISCGRVSDSH